MIWRLITDNDVSDSFGLAADDALAERVGQGVSQPTLRLYTYRSHCALVGRFQRIENEIYVDYCQTQGIALNRRPTGGGAIIMGAGQLGVALTIPGQGGETYGHARELMAQFSAGIVGGLDALGVTADFRGKNDIEVDGRKIAGLGVYRAPSGGLLFHASLLVDLDVSLMLKILNTPFEKISDKEIALVSTRVSTVRREVGREVALDEVRQEVAAGYAGAFNIELDPGDFTPDERQAIMALEQEKYLSEDWVFQTTAVPDTMGSAKVKMPTGLLDVSVTMAGRMIKAVFISGDFFAPDNAIADLEASLRWHTSDPEAVTTTLQQRYPRWQSELNAIPLVLLTKTIQAAVQQANVSEAKARSNPYGCFVTPGGGHG
jgi:lipoate-protein ligase A